MVKERIDAMETPGVKAAVTCPACGEVVPVDAAAAVSGEAEPGPDTLQQFLEVTRHLAGAPREAELVRLKEVCGGLFCFPFNQDLVYLYRPVRLEEYEAIVDSVARGILAGDDSRVRAERELNTQLVCRCAVWPPVTPANKGGLPAGVVPTLANLIHLVSGFFPSEELKTMVVSL